MKKALCIGTCCGLAAAWVTCAQDAQPNLQEAIQQLMQQAQAGSEKKAVAIIDFRDMKALMPDALDLESPGPMERDSIAGEKSGVFGMVVSLVEATYKHADGGTITIKVTDMGTMSGFAAMAQAGWAHSEMDRETKHGFERTDEIQGHKALLKHDSQYGTSEIDILAESRMMFEVKGRKVPFEAVQDAVDALPVDDYLALIDKAAEATEGEEAAE